MSLDIIELTVEEVTGFNKKAIENANRKSEGASQVHQLVRRKDLESCLGGIFFQSAAVPGGYLNLPLEKMAGLLLYRIAQGQFFMDGNKRTALLSARFFLFNNGFGVFQERCPLCLNQAAFLVKPREGFFSRVAGLSSTESMRFQLRVSPDQRLGAGLRCS